MAVGTATSEAPLRGLGLPSRSWQHELAAIRIVWQRDLIRFWQDRTRMVASLVQPALFLFVLGTGLSQLTSGSFGGISLKTFMFPGIVAMSTLFTALFSAGSIVWDREFGFMREMLVAPVSRSAIVLGKCFGGATVATIQGLVILALAGAVGVPYSPALMIELIGTMLLLSFTLTALGVAAAARMRNIQSFFGLMQVVVMPMFFLSGALYPLGNLPGWLRALTRIDPITYAVDPMRRLVFNHLDVTSMIRARLAPGLTWNGWPIPIPLELALVILIGVIMLGLGIWEFRLSD
ncbi:MAG: type transport system permease protein [Actinomycetota bacterium]|jgi:ABC-2 type transport system permease protein|nr:type transport system permease protein [Actinomycetota bacterium]